jgi:citronellol/citronellal dehydrogenase
MSESARRLEGRRALVTGASRGIGAAIAERLAAEGADVAIVARSDEGPAYLPGTLAETAARMAPFGGKVIRIKADLTDGDARAEIVPEAEAGLGGPVEILVNNAAAAMYEPVAAISLKRRRIMFEANVHAPLDLAQAVVPAMIERGEGWIINLSSGSTRLWGVPPDRLGSHGSTITLYGSTKAALNRITDGLAVELLGTGIRVNTVEPRAAVLSEGAEKLVGATLRPDQIESMEEMVEATIALCDGPAELTGRIAVSLDLIAELGLEVRNLDGTARPR